MLKEAMQFWDAIAGKVKQLIRSETQNAFRCERYEVSTAANGSVVGVHKPYGSKELFLPYSAEVADAAVGDPVLVVWWGSMSNAKVYYLADGFKGYAGSDNRVLSVDGKTGDVAVLPAGGSAGQTLAKSSAADYEVEWTTPFQMVGALWENASPNVSFSAQTVSLDLSEYIAVAVVSHRSSTSYNAYQYTTDIIFKGTTGMLRPAGYACTYRAAAVSDAGVAFTAGQYTSTYNGAPATDNTVAIPVYIYGIRGISAS